MFATNCHLFSRRWYLHNRRVWTLHSSNHDVQSVWVKY